MSNEQTSPSLAQWLQSEFTTLYENSEAEEDSANGISARIQYLFSPAAQIYINHSGPLPSEEFLKHVKAFGSTKAEVDWKECFDVNNNEEQSDTAGIVAGYFIITRTLKFRIRAAPAKNITHVSFSAKISHEPGAEKSSDTKQIVQLFYTFKSIPAPVHFQGIQSRT
ncbi:hypothetical protein EV360DRAFT_84785 [Lentinula raphanica]|nr:hypothetical protein EV360DRAFT_84785 [Lentinula raphanica]